MLYCLFQQRELVLAGLCVYVINNSLRTWDDYESCYAPTQLFVFEMFSLILLQRILSHVRMITLIPQMIRNYMSLFLYLIVNPAFLLITIQGVVWQILNKNFSPGCMASEGMEWKIWLLIVSLFVIDGVVISMIVGNIIAWKRFRSLRRRQHETINEIQIIDEYMESGLERMFLNGNLFDDADERVCLTYDDLQKLPRETYVEKHDEGRQACEDSCPVCYEEFKDGDEVCNLPSCKHVFHWKCIQGWFGMSILCPMCRSNVKDSLLYTSTSVGSEFGSFPQEDIESLISRRS